MYGQFLLTSRSRGRAKRGQHVRTHHTRTVRERVRAEKGIVATHVLGCVPRVRVNSYDRAPLARGSSSHVKIKRILSTDCTRTDYVPLQYIAAPCPCCCLRKVVDLPKMKLVIPKKKLRDKKITPPDRCQTRPSRKNFTHARVVL